MQSQFLPSMEEGCKRPSVFLELVYTFNLKCVLYPYTPTGCCMENIYKFDEDSEILFITVKQQKPTLPQDMLSHNF